jgi:glycogen debranching enzyme
MLISTDENLIIKVLNEFHLFRVSLHENVISALDKLHKQVTSFTSNTSPSHSELESIVSQLTLADLNRALYRCEEEERDETKGAIGAYDIPDFGPVVYCGLQGKNSQYHECV